MSIEVINLQHKLSLFSDYWSPKIIGKLNGQAVKLVKLKGEFVMHQHENEDELFLVLDGDLRIEFQDKSVQLGAGEMIIIPRGTMHKPVAEEEVQVLLFEPESTVNTGNLENELTVKKPEDL